MFKDTRINSPFYILHRGDKPRLETGTVQAVSQPVPKMPVNYNAMYPQQPDMVVDIKVKVGDSVLTFEKLPAGSVIADFAAASQNMVVSTVRDNIRAEIEVMQSQSRSILESVVYHETVVAECDTILKDLNPTYAKEKEQEEEIKRLRDEISEMKRSLGGIEEIKQLLKSNQNGTSKKENN